MGLHVATNNTMLDFVEDLIGNNILLYNATFIIKNLNPRHM